MDQDPELSPLSNSFLIETEHNSDIGSDIRRDINSKFNHSKVNSLYVFPRSSAFKLKSKPERPLIFSIKTVKLKRINNSSSFKSNINLIPLSKVGRIKPLVVQSVSNSMVKGKHRRLISEPKTSQSKLTSSPYLLPLIPSSKSKSVKRLMLH